MTTLSALDSPLDWICAVLIALALLVLGAMYVFSQLYVHKTNRHPRQYVRAKCGWGVGVPALADRVGVAQIELENLTPRYRPHRIAKKRGGSRTLHIPEPPLKKLQRRVHRRLLGKLRTHPAATGFEPGTSVAHNAQQHAGQAVVIKMDIVDFFPSTDAKRIEAYFRRVGWNKNAAALLTGLTTFEGGLPQGAPTSPRLSNLVNHGLDARIARFVAKRRGAYTRYADDITISFPEDHPRRVRGTIQYIRGICKAHGYTIHTRGKLRVLRRHQQQRVTGLVVNQQANLSREKRRWLRAVEHRLRTTGQASLTEEQLQGWRAFESMVAEHARSDPASNS